MKILGQRSVHEVLQEWRPKYRDKWKQWIRESYGRYTATDEDEHLRGVKDFVTILGDSGAPELCVLVALYGLNLAKTERDRKSLESHIRIVTFGLGIEAHKNGYLPSEGAPSVDFGNRDNWIINRPAWEAWRDHLLQEFGDDRQAASDFCVRLACVKADVLGGDVAPTFDSLCYAALWGVTKAEQGGSGQVANSSESQ